MLEDKITKLLETSKSKTSILIRDIDEGAIIYGQDAKKKIVSASIIKVGIMLCMMEEIRKGRYDLKDEIMVDDILFDSEVFEDGPRSMSIKELITWMIITSDNTATNAIIRLLGLEYIDSYLDEQLGLESTRLERYMLDEKAIAFGLNNYSSQHDMFILFKKLYHHEILDDELSELAIAILKRQRLQDQLCRYIDYPFSFAHKTGELDYLNHDVGVLEVDDHRYYIGVFIYDTEDIKGDKKLIGKIGKVIFDELCTFKNNTCI